MTKDEKEDEIHDVPASEGDEGRAKHKKAPPPADDRSASSQHDAHHDTLHYGSSEDVEGPSSNGPETGTPDAPTSEIPSESPSSDGEYVPLPVADNGESGETAGQEIGRSFPETQQDQAESFGRTRSRGVSGEPETSRSGELGPDGAGRTEQTEAKGRMPVAERQPENPSIASGREDDEKAYVVQAEGNGDDGETSVLPETPPETPPETVVETGDVGGVEPGAGANSEQEPGETEPSPGPLEEASPLGERGNKDPLTVDDGDGGADTATTTITGSNDGPTAVADTATVGEDSTVTIDVLANDSDPDASDSLSISAANVSIGNGSVSIVDGELQYDPGSDYNYLADGESAQVTVEYTVDDGNGGTDTAIATITVTGSNDGPTAIADAGSAGEDSTVTIDVLANDTDADSSDTLTIMAANVIAGDGTASIVDGELQYDPGSDYNHLADGETAQVTVEYMVDDGRGGTDTATATITVTGSNDGPTAVADTATTGEDSTVTIDVLANDSDPDATDSLLITSANVSAGDGSVSIVDGELQYDPGSDYNYLADGESAQVTVEYAVDDGNGGTDTATATITVTGSNDGPTASDVSYETGEDAAAQNLAFDGADVDASDTLSFSITSQPAEGTVTDNGDGTFDFDPGSDFQDLGAGETREVSFDYTVDDGNGGTDTATATLTVTGSDDGGVTYLTSGRDSYRASNSGETIDALEGNDFVRGGSGDDTIYGGDGRDYVRGEHGDDTLYGGEGNDGVNGGAGDDRVFGGAGDDYVRGESGDDRLEGGAGDDTFDGGSGTDTAVFSGARSDYIITNRGQGGYTVQDTVAGRDGTDWVQSDVENFQFSDGMVVQSDILDGGGNTAPTAADDVGTTSEGSAFTIDVLANDTDLDSGDSLSITGANVTSGSGSASIVGNELQYDPGSNYDYLADGESVDVTINYTIDDGNGGNDSATATVTVTGVSDGPVNITGTSGADLLQGGAGDDTLNWSVDGVWSSNYSAYNGDTGDLENIGGKSQSWDVYDGGDGTDTLLGTDGADAMFLGATNLPYNSGRTGRISNIEIVDLGAGDDVLDMNHPTFHYTDDITVLGGEGDDVIWTDQGNDTLIGGAGNDSFYGGAGDDVLDGGLGADAMDGATGSDTVSYADATSGVEVRLDLGHGSLGEAQGDTYTSVENAVGGAGDDAIHGSSGNTANVLDGGAGNDALHGHGGDDTMIGGTGDDILDGGQGDDLFVYAAGDGSDTIDGGLSGGWTDTIELGGFEGTTPGDDWTIAFDTGGIDTQGGDYLELTEDSSGTITLSDGETIAFEGIERVEW